MANRLLFSGLIILCFFTNVKAQDLSHQAITSSIANDSGNPAENYNKYAASLRLTLSLLSQEQLGRVFSGTSVSSGGLDAGTGDNGTGDNGTGDNGTGDNGTGDNGTGDNGTGDTGTGDTGTNSNAPSNDPAVDQPLIDAINSGLPPGQLKNQLIAASPLSEAVLTELVGASQGLPSGITLNVLMENAPLPENVYLDILTGSANLDSGQIATLSVAQNGG